MRIHGVAATNAMGESSATSLSHPRGRTDRVSTDQHLSQYKCPRCDFELWVPIASLSVSVLGFYNDARFPGRCILVLNEHYEDPTDIPNSLYTAFALDVKTAGLAVASITEAHRINYAVLGNTVPHVHCHIIPRRGAPDDPSPDRPIWESPLPRGQLPRSEVQRIANGIRGQLLETHLKPTDG